MLQSAVDSSTTRVRRSYLMLLQNDVHVVQYDAHVVHDVVHADMHSDMHDDMQSDMLRQFLHACSGITPVHNNGQDKQKLHDTGRDSQEQLLRPTRP